jgi:ppGpp synthetase/RelA/SpoT-type nucleotidyltranferase
MPPSMSASARDRLGERLRKAETPSPADLEALYGLQREYDNALRDVVSRLASRYGARPRFGGWPLQTTHRIKTVNTLIEKLRRSQARLSKVQDLAGIRVVAGWGAGPEHQDRLVADIVEEFGASVYKVDDLRVTPRNGYRAVHVMVEVDGYRVEIQVRTHWQHFWANATERIADQWGRGIRYGELPIAQSPDEQAHRAQAFLKWQQLSDALVQQDRAEEHLAIFILTEAVKLKKEDGSIEKPLEIVMQRPDIQELMSAIAKPALRLLREAGAEVAALVRVSVERG